MMLPIAICSLNRFTSVHAKIPPVCFMSDSLLINGHCIIFGQSMVRPMLVKGQTFFAVPMKTETHFASKSN